MPALEEIRQIPKDPGYIGSKSSTNWAAVILSYLRVCPKGASVPDIVGHLQEHTLLDIEGRKQATSDALDYLESLGLALNAGERWHAKKVRL